MQPSPSQGPSDNGGHKCSPGSESHKVSNTDSQGVQSSVGVPGSTHSNASGTRSNPSSGNVICHGSGEPGYIRPNCPHKVKRVVSPLFLLFFPLLKFYFWKYMTISVLNCCISNSES